MIATLVPQISFSYQLASRIASATNGVDLERIQRRRWSCLGLTCRSRCLGWLNLVRVMAIPIAGSAGAQTGHQ